MRLRRIGSDGDRLCAQRHGIGELLLALTKHCYELQEFGVARLSPQNAARKLLGLVRAAALEQSQRLVQRLLVLRGALISHSFPRWRGYCRLWADWYDEFACAATGCTLRPR